jgi:hypothetical protein
MEDMPRARIVVTGIRWVYRALLAVGAAAIALFAWYSFEATHYQAEYERAFDRLEAERSQPQPNHSDPAARGLESREARAGHEGPGSGTSPARHGANLDGLLGRLEIARVGLKVMVL